ncbi:MAG: Type 1 glutamine amidotransferase-like domain-containing protein [Actinobacteria bacterium]|nr:Type 1 glutamine amidotransferase-like domain-containing protein [Actinomycetota bacterium]
MTGLILGLLGSGEFEPWAGEVDRWLLEHSRIGDGRLLILPTASAPEGDDVFDMWGQKGLEHYRRLGVPAEVVPLKTREDAARPELVSKLDEASVVFFSGGNPADLAAILLDTPFWRSLLEAMARGLAYGGCSAGVACLPDVSPDSSIESLDDAVWKPGLRLFRDVVFMPHWDALDGFMPGLTDFVIRSIPPGSTLFAIDENTAVVGDGSDWSVAGSGAVHLMRDGAWEHHPSGTAFSESLPQRAQRA